MANRHSGNDDEMEDATAQEAILSESLSRGEGCDVTSTGVLHFPAAPTLAPRQ